MKICVYAGQSLYASEENCFSVGWTKYGNLKKACSRKSIHLIYKTEWVDVRNESEAIHFEKVAHKVLDKMYTGRAQVRHGLNDMKGSKPNRSDEWWFIPDDEHYMIVKDDQLIWVIQSHLEKAIEDYKKQMTIDD